MKLGVVSITIVISLLLCSSQAAPLVIMAMAHSSSSSSSNGATSVSSPLAGTHQLTRKRPTNGKGRGNTYRRRRDLDKQLAPVDHLDQPHGFISRHSGESHDDGVLTTHLAANTGGIPIQTLIKRVRMKSDGEPEIFNLGGLAVNGTLN